MPTGMWNESEGIFVDRDVKEPLKANDINFKKKSIQTTHIVSPKNTAWGNTLCVA